MKRPIILQGTQFRKYERKVNKIMFYRNDADNYDL